MTYIKTIFSTSCRIVACFSISLLLSCGASAGDVVAWAKGADIVCVARLASTQTVDDASTDPTTPYKTVLNKLRVIKVLKGHLPPGGVQIESHPLDLERMRRLGITTLSGRRPFGGFAPGEDYLLFVNYTPDTPYVNMISDTSAIDIGSKLADMSQTEPLLANIVSQFSVALSGSNQESQLSVLDTAGSFGTILWERTPASEGVAAQELASISKQDKAAITRNLQEQLVPAVLALAKSDDTTVKAFALSTAAGLQVEEVITPLITFAHASPSYSSLVLPALGDYKSLKATSFLVPLLESPSAKVREAAATSLRSIQDRRSLPFLLNALHDDDETVAYLACYTLWEITNQYPPPALAAFPSSRESYMLRWNIWAKANKIEIERLKQEVNRK